MTADTPGRDDTPATRIPTKPPAVSQADEALRRAIAATPITAPAKPMTRRTAAVWGW